MPRANMIEEPNVDEILAQFTDLLNSKEDLDDPEIKAFINYYSSHHELTRLMNAAMQVKIAFKKGIID